jgi:ubiquinone/menaquinone biosynthesis C-methylase UbiE
MWGRFATLPAGAAFDALAARYDSLWSDTAIGLSQRQAVWRHADPLFHPGQRILDLGCGAGTDAVHYMARGVQIHAIDASAEMVRLAAARGVDARHLAIENLSTLTGGFDGALSNFGALNCVARLEPVAAELGRLIRPSGWLAVCAMGRTCAWEVCHYLRGRQPSKAFRRWNPRGIPSSIGIHVTYPSVRQLTRAFRRQFRLVRWCGIGLFVPPSYVRVSGTARLESLDRHLAHLPLARALADHRLLVWQRL